MTRSVNGALASKTRSCKYFHIMTNYLYIICNYHYIISKYTFWALSSKGLLASKVTTTNHLASRDKTARYLRLGKSMSGDYAINYSARYLRLGKSMSGDYSINYSARYLRLGKSMSGDYPINYSASYLRLGKSMSGDYPINYSASTRPVHMCMSTLPSHQWPWIVVHTF